ncbi:MAG TPA: hypothetical protein VFK05_35880 [Polyangiaceae bacterium]|nr:hypothetical protein [Polyangiaceae bacterium]
MAQLDAWFFGALLGCSTIACAPSQHTPKAAPPRVESTTPAGFLEGKPGKVRSHQLDFPIELSLPDKADWQISEGPSWLVLSQGASSSQLALRTWRADRLVRRAECEAQARLGRPSIPSPREEAVVDRQTLSVPADFDNELLVAVEPSARGISGYAFVFGASTGRCYAAVFTTSVSGKDAEREVAARLGLVVDRVLSKVRVLSVDARAPRRHLVVTPKAAGE